MKIEYRDYLKRPLTAAEITRMIKLGKRLARRDELQLLRVLQAMANPTKSTLIFN